MEEIIGSNKGLKVSMEVEVVVNGTATQQNVQRTFTICKTCVKRTL